MLAIIAVIFTASLISWPFVDDEIPMHWNFQGEVDRYGGKAEGLLLLPAITAGLYLLLAFLPRIDPARQNYDSFVGSYTLIRIATIALMAGIHAIVLATAFGADIDTLLVVSIGVGVLFIVLGSVMGKLRPNFFAGIRTPWTLSSVKSWNASHRVGGWIFIASGLAFLGMALIREDWYLIAILVAQGSALTALVAYSWWIWRNDPHRVPAASAHPLQD